MSPRSPPSGDRTATEERPRRFQMRVVTKASVRQEFLDMCHRENVYPNRILGGYIERAVRRGRL
jgi:hypothetical protein